MFNYSSSSEECIALVKEKGLMNVNQGCDTVLHILAIKGNVCVFRALVEQDLVSIEALRRKNVKGYTALHEAVRYGHKEVAEIMLMQDNDLVFMEDDDGETPLYVAAKYGKDEVFRVLENFGSDCFAKRNDGRTVLHAAIDGEHYRLATNILAFYPSVAEEHDQKGLTALNLLATKRLSFKSGSSYVFSDLSRSPFIPFQVIGAIIYLAIPEMYVECETVVDQENQHDVRAGITKRSRSFCWKTILAETHVLAVLLKPLDLRTAYFFLCLPWMREIDREKQKHGLALVLAKRLILKEDWSCYALYSSSSMASPMNPLIQATVLGNTEMIKAILTAFPEVADSLDENGRNILHIAVERKNLHLYEYLKKNLFFKDRMLTEVDKNGNTILHFASCVGIPFSYSSPALSMQESNTVDRVVSRRATLFGGATDFPILEIAGQMSWDVYWFKHAKLDCYPHIRYLENFDGKTADELFEENHLHLREEATRVCLDMINSTIVVAVLFCTVNYAALFTVPGGFDQNSGLPVLDKNNTLFKFLVSVYAAIFCSFVCLAALLSAQQSRFNTEDFYIMLPLKGIVASIGLMLSAAFTITASAQALVLESNKVKSSFLLSLLYMGYTIMILMVIDMRYLMIHYLYYVILDLFFNNVRHESSI